MAVNPVPEGFHTVTPYLTVRDAAAFLAFLGKAFGATVKECMRGEDGTVLHAEAVIGDSIVMIGEARPPTGVRTATLYLYLPAVDPVFRAAVAAGATSVQDPADQFYGDRTAAARDPFGNEWWLASHVEDVPPDEMARRAAARPKRE